ncbi:MAG TPA: biotin/lipoyl-containing protein [Bryobacteraceae bacterium]|nr:biotin/lipoyl-containing protein [Bryobacteraceae bacterium]
MTVIRLNGREIRLDFTQEGETWRFRVESEVERTAGVRQVAPGVYSVILDGRSYEATLDGNCVSVGGRAFEVEIVDTRRWSREGNHAHAGGRQNVSSAMPGKVIRVLVAAGDEVEAGQGLIVVEAMKMQNELKAIRAGRVRTVTTMAGRTVNAGEILATIE